MDTATLLWLSFLAGLYAPVGAPCALVLYPGYISFLAGRAGNHDRNVGRNDERNFSPFLLGCLAAAGVIVAMLAGGFLFSVAIQVGGSMVRDLITPAAFILLFILSLMLIFNLKPGQFSFLQFVPRLGNPLSAAFILGVTFGIIILPCNAAAVFVFIALASTASGLFEGLEAFLLFGLGITLPLLIIAGLTRSASRQLMGYLTRHHRGIQIAGGIVMLAISAWYLTLLIFPGIFR